MIFFFRGYGGMGFGGFGGCLGCLAISYFVVVIALTHHVRLELDWYDGQRSGTCKEYGWNLRGEYKSCGKNCGEKSYFCDIKVYLWDDADDPAKDIRMEKRYVAGEIGGRVKQNEGGGWTPIPSIAEREDMCSSMLKEGPEAEFDCYYEADDELVRKERTEYPLAAVIGMVVMWCPIFALSVFFVIRPVVATLLSKSGLRASHGSDRAPIIQQAPPHSNVFSPTTSPHQSQKAPPPKPTPPKEPKPKGTRKLKEEDLCDELIPGLKLRALYPQYGLAQYQRWFSATAVSYCKVDAPWGSRRTITAVWDDDAPWGVGGHSFTLPMDKKVRLHEDALGLVAKHRIRQGIMERALFKGLSFQSLDANGDGELDADELTTGLAKQGIQLDGETTEALLDGLDIDKTGKVSAANFRDFLANSKNPNTSNPNCSIVELDIDLEQVNYVAHEKGVEQILYHDVSASMGINRCARIDAVS